VMFIVLAFEAYVRRDRPLQAAMFSALAVLVRLDSSVLAGLLAMHALIMKRRVP
jgi:hypothetical protein